MGTDSKPAAHQLAAADYSLGSPDFATPALGQRHALTAMTYSLGPLDFAASYVAPYVPGVWRIVWCGNEGRPPAISPDKVPGLIAVTRAYLTKRQITSLRRISDADRDALYEFARARAKDAGVQATDRILREQIIGPALSKE